MNLAPAATAQQQSYSSSSSARAQQQAACSSSGSSSSGGSCRGGPPARCRGQMATRGGADRRLPFSHQRHQRRGGVQCGVQAIAVPGPLFISEGFDRERLNNSKTHQLTPTGSFLQFPLRNEAETRFTPPLVRVRLAVEYRVHSRQMICIGGSHIPFGWSFLSIAKVPASWNPGDIWAVEVELPAGTKVEYKYVILEEQDWTQQVNELSEGKVEYTYRIEPDSSPPDVQKITKQMAIVAWQPGPNRVLQVPTEEELAQLKPGDRIDRAATPPPAPSTQRSYGQQAVGKLLGGSGAGSPPPPFPEPGSSASSGGSSSGSQPRQEELQGVWEVLTIDQDGRAYLDRRDVWGREDQSQRPVRRPLFGR